MKKELSSFLNSGPEITTNETITDLISAFKNRARRNQRIAIIYLTLIVLVFISGVYLFAFSYKFTSFGKVSEDISTIKRSFDGLHIEAYGISADLDSIRDVIRRHPLKTDEINFEQLSGRTFYLTNSVEQVKLDLNQIVSLMRSDTYTRVEYQFYDSLTTKIGTTIILLFVIQLLVRVFRYHSRLNNYYKARADALEIMEIRKDSFQISLNELIAVLSPDEIDIGIAKTPIEQMIQFAREYNKK